MPAGRPTRTRPHSQRSPGSSRRRPRARAADRRAQQICSSSRARTPGLRIPDRTRGDIQCRRRNPRNAPQPRRRILSWTCRSCWISRRGHHTNTFDRTNECDPAHANIVLLRSSFVPGRDSGRNLRRVARAGTLAQPGRSGRRPSICASVLGDLVVRPRPRRTGLGDDDGLRARPPDRSEHLHAHVWWKHHAHRRGHRNRPRPTDSG